MSELNQDAKALLEQALMEANREREKTILKGAGYSLPSPSHSYSDDYISQVILFYSLLSMFRNMYLTLARMLGLKGSKLMAFDFQHISLLTLAEFGSDWFWHRSLSFL
ncbi:hypothetical protein Hanom_Chr11g01015031 [Helianthus anomalus]